MKLLEQILTFSYLHIQLEGMDQVRSNRKLHVMVIVKVVPVVITHLKGKPSAKVFFLAGLAVPGFNSEFVFNTTVKRPFFNSPWPSTTGCFWFQNQQVEACLRSQSVELVSEIRHLQRENSRTIRPSL